MPRARLAVAQEDAVHARAVRHAQHGPHVAGDLDAVQHQQHGVVGRVEGGKVVRGQPGEREHPVRLAALGDLLERFGGHGIALLGARGEFVRQRRGFGRADVLGAEDEAVEGGVEFFAQGEDPDPFGGEQLVRVGLGVGEDRPHLFDLGVLFPDRPPGMGGEYVLDVHMRTVTDFSPFVKRNAARGAEAPPVCQAEAPPVCQAERRARSGRRGFAAAAPFCRRGRRPCNGTHNSAAA